MLEAVLVLAAAVAEAFRTRRALLAENALLRHQLAVLQRQLGPAKAKFAPRTEPSSPHSSSPSRVRSCADSG